MDALISELKSSLEWSDSAMATLRHVWKEEGPKLIAMPKQTLSIGQVSSMLWSQGGERETILFPRSLYPWTGSWGQP